MPALRLGRARNYRCRRPIPGGRSRMDAGSPTMLGDDHTGLVELAGRVLGARRLEQPAA